MWKFIFKILFDKKDKVDINKIEDTKKISEDLNIASFPSKEDLYYSENASIGDPAILEEPKFDDSALIQYNKVYCNLRAKYYANGKTGSKALIKEYYDKVRMDGSEIFMDIIYPMHKEIRDVFMNIFGKRFIYEKKDVIYANGGGFRERGTKVTGGAKMSPHYFGLALDFSFNQFIKDNYWDEHTLEELAQTVIKNKDRFKDFTGLRLMFYPRHVHYDFVNHTQEGLTYVSLKPSYSKPEIKRLYWKT